MFNIIKNIILKTDKLLFKKFGSDKSLKSLENIKEAEKIFSYINEIGEETRIKFVGGCVRKALSAENIDDIDLATTLQPNEVKNKLIAKGVRVIETGITHGTLTAIINEKKFEITTLRKDISTDGRHAKVEFTLNWEEDSGRRDFTINAIYADLNGRIFDPHNGLSDLQNGKVKFIGLVEERITEDYLRILRYFRFFTQYSKVSHDLETIQIIKRNINGINQISNERIFDELKKIVLLKNIQEIFINKQSKEIILNIFPQFKYYERLKNINNLDKRLKSKYDFCLLIASLIIDETNNYEYFCHKYKTSNSIKNRLKYLSNNFENIKSKNFYIEKNIKKLIYLSSKEEVNDLILFSIFINNKKDISTINKLLEYVEYCEVPKFPISGDYLKKAGYVAGKSLGQKLKELEEQWIENNFKIDEKVAKKYLNKII